MPEEFKLYSCRIAFSHLIKQLVMLNVVTYEIVGSFVCVGS